jgi:D-alanyl-D-alanine dipeptidase
VFPSEWWHFDYRDWKEYAIQNVPFETIANR